MSHQEFQECINACYECTTACEYCLASFLEERDIRTMAHCLQLAQDCADICSLNARLLARRSPYAMKFTALCAELCEACAEGCGRQKAGHCHHCAEACQRCAAECRKLLPNASVNPAI